MSSLTPEERHKIILEHLKEKKKATKVFHLRWNETDLITSKILITTPAFWYMKYGWKRKQVEQLLFVAEIEVNYELEKSLNQVYGGSYDGPRWRSNKLKPKLDDLWEKFQKKKTKKNINLKIGSLNQQQLDPFQQQQQQQQAASTGNNAMTIGQINFSDFKDALLINNVTITDDLARSIFAQIDINSNGYITKTEMDSLLTKLDAMDFDIINLTNNQNMLNLAMTKKVLDCVLSDDISNIFNENQFIFQLSANISVINDPEALNYLSKLGDRTINFNDRLIALNKINENIENGKWSNLLINDNNLHSLLLGLAAQILDDNNQIQLRAMEIIPNLLDECFTNGKVNLNIVYEHLADIMDNMFAALDNPACAANHAKIQYGIDEIIDNVVNTQHPTAVLILTKVFTSKTDIQNVNNPAARLFGLKCLTKIIFGIDSPYLTFNIKSIKAPTVDQAKLPLDPYKEWLNISTQNQIGPSKKLMNQSNKPDNTKKYQSGGQNDLQLGWGHYKDNKDNDDDKKDNNDNDNDNDDYTGVDDINIIGSGKNVSSQQNQPLHVNKHASGSANDLQLGWGKYSDNMSSDDIGNEFVDHLSSGLSNSIMDPNRNNKMHAFKVTNILDQLKADCMSSKLNKESKRRYDQWSSGDMKPWDKKKPKKKLPMKKIQPRLVSMQTKTPVKMNYAFNNLPDI